MIHIGSVATLVEPGSSELRAWIHQQSVPVIFDPNVRPSIEPDKERYRAAVERWIEISSIVKLSQDDVLWLYGNESVVHTWLERGVSIVVLTRADKGITVFGTDFSIEIPAVAVSVVDTVGAGDTIGAVVVEGVLIHGVNALRGEVLQGVLERAARAASITCSRAGANPPTRDELENS